MWRLANAAFDGQLAQRLGELRGKGLSWQAIGIELYVERGVRLSHEALRRWAIQLGVVNRDGTAVEPTAPEAAAS